MEQLEFVKLSGSGNDFICLDNRDGRFDALIASGAAGRLARHLCRRGLSVGADGLVFAEKSEFPQADASARFYEPDGSQAELCGNGAACFVHWALSDGWTGGSELRLLTSAGVVRGHKVDGQYVRVCIPLPEDMQRDIRLDLAGQPLSCDYLVAGVPHAVVYVQDVETVDVPHLGALIRRHARFAPRGVNVNFVQVLGEGRLAVRTFEFGVEDETLACGTGSAASAILAALRFGWPARYGTAQEPVLVRARGGDVLRVWFTYRPDGAFDDLCLDTTVRCIYFGRLCPELLDEALKEA